MTGMNRTSHIAVGPTLPSRTFLIIPCACTSQMSPTTPRYLWTMDCGETEHGRRECKKKKKQVLDVGRLFGSLLLLFWCSGIWNKTKTQKHKKNNPKPAAYYVTSHSTTLHAAAQSTLKALKPLSLLLSRRELPVTQTSERGQRHGVG